MFKMILSAIVALGLGSVAYAADPAAAPADAPKMDAPAGEMPADHGKMDHGKMDHKKMDKMDKKGKKKHKADDAH